MDEARPPHFRPGTVYIDKEVKDLPYTKEVLARLGSVHREIISDSKEISIPGGISAARKDLLLTCLKSDPLREFPAMTKRTGRPTYSLDLIANCPLECTYCILQSSLEENTLITVFTNLEEILQRLENNLERIPRGSVVGTGQIADSLVLEEFTCLHQRLIPFFARQDRVRLELKTRVADVEPLLGLVHKGQTVISWSLSPERIQMEEEVRTAPVSERIAAMSECQQAGYQVGLHFDPIIHHTHWEKNYKKLIEQVFSAISSEQVSWVSIGILRFPASQVKVMRQRFPNRRKIFSNLTSTQRRMMHYPERLSDSMYKRMREYLSPFIPTEKIYISMESEQVEVRATKKAS